MAVASCCKYFEEDIVYRVNRNGNLVYGLVLENSEFVSSDEEDDKKSGQDEDWERVKKGHVRVAWHPRGEEEVISERKAHLADRSLMPSDVVRRVVKGKDTQRGYCRNVYVTACCQIVGTRQVIYNISSKDLTPLEEFTVDIAVFLDSWVGMVKVVKTKVFLLCFDGSRCALSSDDACDLDDILDKRERDSEFKKYDFFPGQLLWGPVRCFDNAEWFYMTDEMKSLKNKPKKTIRATVESVKVVSIGVHWQCRAYTKDSSLSNGELQQPKYLVPEEDLKRVKMLNVFEPCTLQLGDRNYYKIKDSDVLLTKEQWRRLHRETLLGPKPNSCSTLIKDDEELSKAQHSDSTEKDDDNDSEFDDIEDDSNMSDTASISSRSSVSSSGKGKKVKSRPSLVTKVLKKLKLKRAKRKTSPNFVSVKTGDEVVVETLSTSSVVEVVWQDGTVENDVPSTSLYPIHHLDDQEFFPGDFVVDNKDFVNPHDYGVIKKVDHNGRTALIRWLKTYTQGSDPSPVCLNEEEVSVYDLKDHSDFKYRPGSVIIRVANFESEDPEYTAGQVLDVHPNGMVEVGWVNSLKSFCYPQDLYKVGEYDSEEGELWDDGDDSDDSWETESELSIPEEEETLTETVDDKILRPKLAANIERARASMARLEEIFIQNPALQTSTAMKQLIQVYKDCKYLDRLMGTTFFHESHFQGLLERVRDRGRRKCAQRVADQVSRLFQSSPDRTCNESEIEDKLDGVCASLHDMTTQQSSNMCNGHAQLICSKTCRGVYGCELLSPHEHPLETIGDGGGTGTEDGHVANMCTKLCSLLKIQLLKAHEDVMKRFGQPNKNISDEASNSVIEHPEKVDEKSKLLDDTSIIADLQCDKNSVGCESPLVTGSFSTMGAVPDCHIFKLTLFQPTDTKEFFRAVWKEIKLLKTSLPEGIIFKGFDDRMDLYSVMIKGPQRTPYEDGLFFFDLQLSTDYPKTPPTCHYISYCTDRLNPNLYEDGKVCVSLLGTWGGKGTEVWTCTSNLLQVMVSIQGLILVSEPYFNEAGYERQKGTQQGRENSRMYNEMVILKLVQSMGKLLLSPPEIFKEEIIEHFKKNGLSFIHRLEKWLEISEGYNGMHPATPTTPTAFLNAHGGELAERIDVSLPEFPLIPASKGFCITLRKTLSNFREILIDSIGRSEGF